MFSCIGQRFIHYLLAWRQAVILICSGLQAWSLLSRWRIYFVINSSIVHRLFTVTPTLVFRRHVVIVSSCVLQLRLVNGGAMVFAARGKRLCCRPANQISSAIMGVWTNPWGSPPIPSPLFPSPALPVPFHFPMPHSFPSLRSRPPKSS